MNKTNDGLPFSLLDWRQNFGRSYVFGDIYYDLAKLHHGLIISHDFIILLKSSFFYLILAFTDPNLSIFPK